MLPVDLLPGRVLSVNPDLSDRSDVHQKAKKGGQEGVKHNVQKTHMSRCVFSGTPFLALTRM